MPIEKIKASVADVASSFDSKLKDSLSFLSEIKEASTEKINTLVNDILGLAPLIEVSGFNMKELSVDATLPPCIILTFLKEKDVSPETIDKLLQENQNKDLLNLIVRALQQADALQKGLKISGYSFRGLNLKIGLPPDISLKFIRTGT